MTSINLLWLDRVEWMHLSVFTWIVLMVMPWPRLGVCSTITRPGGPRSLAYVLLELVARAVADLSSREGGVPCSLITPAVCAQH